ncbi:MAG: Rieske 2Fe-2S domain-containing protein [Gammaproteobacteria bacterium]|nr:Rieske 2Fe-2S domain-containing protein [Gammaproteobacteria bacterium]MDH3464550.1 Rieske 2Fe-2S domain-containing protein [Gammaproteobacteria bacterium]
MNLEFGPINNALQSAPNTARDSATVRRQQLIDATIRTIAEFGLSRTTVARVTETAALSPGIVNFYFKSKDALLVATLRFLVQEFESTLYPAIDSVRGDVEAALLAVIERWFDPVLADPRKVVVRYAFWSESQTRKEYLELCGDSDAAFGATVAELFARLAAAPEFAHVNAEAAARGFEGLLDGYWQQLIIDGNNFDRDVAMSTSRDYLQNVFPGRFITLDAIELAEPEQIARTLPAWIYQNQELFELERDTLFATAWQIAGHISEVPSCGDYVTLELHHRRAFVVRDEQGKLRAFHNSCRHRGHAVVAGNRGHCDKFLQCQYHGWAYHFDGRLRAVPAEKSFPGIDRNQIGLPELELEVFLGFIFIRFESDGPSVAERMAPYRNEMAAYKFEQMTAIDGLWNVELDIDWKNVMDNYLEDYHFPIGHPGLYGLMNAEYSRDVCPQGVSRLSHSLRDIPAGGWSERMYHRLLPVRDDLPEELRRRWSYFTLFPNVTFDVYPDRMDYFEMLPLAPGRCRLRGRSYALADSRREMRAARYLNRRINQSVQREDEKLTESVQKGLASGGYHSGLLSEMEVVVKGFHDWLRRELPIVGNHEPPPPGGAMHTRRRLIAGV